MREVLCSTVIELAPEFAEGWNRRATVRYLATDIDGSIADVNATLDLEPRHFGALSGLGLCFPRTGRTGESGRYTSPRAGNPPLCDRCYE